MPPDAIAARLARLEGAHRRLRRVVLALACALIAALVVAAGDDGVLSGRTLKLLDDAGRVRVLLTTSSGLSFLDAGSRPRAILGIDAEGGPGLVLNGDTSRAIFNVNRDGPALALTAEHGSLRAILALVKGQPGLVFFDGEERERLHLAVANGGGRGTLLDATGTVTWRVPGAD
jgi:hypothetical protein